MFSEKGVSDKGVLENRVSENRVSADVVSEHGAGRVVRRSNGNDADSDGDPDAGGATPPGSGGRAPVTVGAAATVATGAQPARPVVTAKGLGPSGRPARLEYTAPTVDGAAGTSGVTRTRGASTSAASAPAVGGSEPYPNTPRNAACPCGSGKKYKRCHGDPRNRNTPAAQ